jgi:proline iminopeptidase
MNRRLKRIISTSILMCISACATPEQQSEREALPLRGTVAANGIDFEYFIEGTGRACIVVGDALTASRALSQRLREHFRFVFLDSRMTTPEEQVGDVSGITMDTLVDDIEQARQALQLGDVCVLGHSISGILALEYARKYPQHTTHVIMHGTPPFVDERNGPIVAANWDANATQERKDVLEANWSAISADSLGQLPPGEASILEYITNAPRYFHDPSYDPSWLFDGAYWNQAAWNHLFGVIMATYDLDHGAPVETPVFLAIGRDDFALAFNIWDGERNKIPDLSYNLFDESGHYPMLEEQELFDRLLLEWIGTH